MNKVYDVIRYRVSRCSALLHDCKNTIRSKATETLNPRSQFWDKYRGLKLQASTLYACIHLLKYQQTQDMDDLNEGFLSHSISFGMSQAASETLAKIEKQLADGKTFKVIQPPEVEVVQA